MSMPDEMYLGQQQDRCDEYYDIVEDEPFKGSTRYIRADIHKALKAEVQALKRKLISYMQDSLYHPMNDADDVRRTNDQIEQLEAELKEQSK